MWESLVAIGALLTSGVFSFKHLNDRVNRVEDNTNSHFTTLEGKVDSLNREVGEVKVIVERMEKKLG